MLFDDLDEQLYPEKLNPRIKAIMLLHSANLTEQQQIQLSLKRAGTQTWAELTGRTDTVVENVGPTTAVFQCLANCVRQRKDEARRVRHVTGRTQRQ